MNDNNEKKTSIIVIAVSVILVAIVLFWDFKDINLSSIIEDTGIKEIFTPLQEIGGMASELVDEQSAIKEELQRELNSNGELPSLYGTVVEIEDCSTYLLNVKGKETRYRLIGVTIIEETQEQALSALRDKIVTEDFIFIEYDAITADDYGRTLAYLYMSSGEMIQEWLISNGYAYYSSDGVNTSHEADLQQIMVKVKE